MALCSTSGDLSSGSLVKAKDPLCGDCDIDSESFLLLVEEYKLFWKLTDAPALRRLNHEVLATYVEIHAPPLIGRRSFRRRRNSKITLTP